MDKEKMNQEIQEAIGAGERALQSLYAVREKLESARKWGIFDMLGGGFVSGMIKHSRLDDASTLLETAKHDLRVFQKELRDVQMNHNLRMEIGTALSFADIFFDGIIVDYMVQSRIAEIRGRVDDSIHKVKQIVENLKRGQLR